MGKYENGIELGEMSQNTLMKSNLSNRYEDGVELINDVEIVEELSVEAKKRQEQALLAAKQKVMTTVDKNKLKIAMKEIQAIELYSEVLTDPEVIDRVKANTRSAMDMKFWAEAQKMAINNLGNLMRMDSVDEKGTAGEVLVDVEWSGSGGGTTKVVVAGKR